MAQAETKRVRYAVIGAGNIAQVAILPAFRNATENSELVALISGEREKREALARRHNLIFTGGYDDLERVLAEGRIDAVYITVPNSLHRGFAERAATHGVHVLCEKPLAETVEDCEAMIRACATRNLKLMTAYRLHFEEATLRAIDLVKSGAIGQPRLFTASFTQQVRAGDVRTKKSLGGGALYDMGVYCINAARNLFRDEPEEVVALSTGGIDDRFDGVDETTSCVLRFSGGRLAQLSASLGTASTSSYTLIGSKGSLRVEPAFDYTVPLVHHLTVGDKTTTTTFEVRDQFAPELVHFSRAILEHGEPGPSGEEGLADVRIVRALLQSAQENRSVRLLPQVRAHRPDLRQLIKKPAIKPPPTIDAPAPRQS
ncbi:MAG: Gfo/Idh/MocA family oxidoreductase [Polyangiales bacterium]